jgi:hypothetical protein
MEAADRSDVVVAVNDGAALRVEPAGGTQSIESGVEQTKIPAVEQVAGDDEVPGPRQGERGELRVEPLEVRLAAQV